MHLVYHCLPLSLQITGYELCLLGVYTRPIRPSIVNFIYSMLTPETEAEWRVYAWVQHNNIGSDNGLSPVRRQAIIWNNAAILPIRPEGTYFSEILPKIKKVFIHGNAIEKCLFWGSISVDCELQNGRHFADDIFKCISWLMMFELRLKFHWDLFLRSQLTLF